MERRRLTPRKDYQAIIEGLGFNFHHDYWLEDACYCFTVREVDEIERATKECYDMYCEATEVCLKDDKLLQELCIPPVMWEAIRRSWEEDDLSLYGRFDFVLDHGIPKLLEFNADTPTSLIEASLIQWQWKEQVYPDNDQYNGIEEGLVQSWRDIHQVYQQDVYYFTSVMDCEEDNATLAYLLYTAQLAGLTVAEMDIESVYLDDGSLYVCSQEVFEAGGGEAINCMFKLFPWETMFKNYPDSCLTEMCWIEPLWKSLMSNKAMLPILYRMFPNSPYILPAFREEGKLRSYCKKPIFSREGANIELIRNGACLGKSDGEYGEEGYIYQELVDEQSYHGKYPVLGSWVIGGEPGGMGIRETAGRITDNMSHFVPHIIL